MNCHAIFWENPGIPSTCTEKYEEGLTKGYFLMQDDSVWNGRFGYGMDPGALVDFCNPAARKWWAQLHNFMIDFASDGVAGDHGEEVYGTMYSPYSEMSGEEYHNLYSMLYDMASWQAYKARNPNKRCVVWGRSLWAGCQRYPMQGTQDSHSEGKNIHGEIMGTDNVTREILDSQKKDWPLSRLSQYLCLTVAGERTELFWTGRKTADDNYRFYGKLRYRLMPYIYTYARMTTRTALPLVRALVLEYQDDPNTYSVYGQYLLGKELLIAPLWSDTTFSRQIYLPKGQWIDFWDGTIYEGWQTINYNAPITKAPILVKAGAIIPMAPDNQKFVDEKKSPLTIRIYPKGTSSFVLYEDDGVGYDYEKKSAPSRSYKVPQRDHIFEVHKQMHVKLVTKADKKLPRFKKKAKFDAAPEGWFYDAGKMIIWAKVKGGANEPISLRFWNIVPAR
jgi:alpha-D-xyloside xylohydrolase